MSQHISSLYMVSFWVVICKKWGNIYLSLYCVSFWMPIRKKMRQHISSLYVVSFWVVTRKKWGKSHFSFQMGNSPLKIVENSGNSVWLGCSSGILQYELISRIHQISNQSECKGITLLYNYTCTQHERGWILPIAAPGWKIYVQQRESDEDIEK